MADPILIYTLLVVFAATLVVPFVIGLVRGPDAHPARPHPAGEAPLRPLGRVTGVYLRFLALYGLAAVVSFATGEGGLACATGSATATPVAGYPARPGAVVRAAGVQACALHPSAGQWILSMLIRLPGPIVLATVLLMIWQLVREARRGGPFTARAVAIMSRLGLVVLIGTAVAGAVSRAASDVLLGSLLTDPRFIDPTVGIDVVPGALRALLPVPLLAGVALISFARITRAGLALDEEVRATV
jgi:hypothetical protein